MRQSTLYAIQMIKNFRFGSNFFKYFLRLLLCMLIPFVFICVLLYQSYGTSAVKTSYSHMKQAHQQSLFTIDNMLENIQNKYFELCLSNDFQSLMTLKSDPMHGFATDNYVRVVSDIMSQMFNSTDLIYAIDIYSSYNNYVISNRYSGSLETVAPHWLAAYKSCGSGTFTAVTEGKEGRFLTISFDVFYNRASYGMIVFSVDLDKLEALTVSAQEEPMFYIALTDADNRLIYSDNPAYAKKFLASHTTVADDGQSMISSKLSLPNLVFDSFVNPAVVGRSKAVMYSILLLLILVSVIVPFILALFLSLNNYTLISKITYQLQQIADFPVDPAADANETMYILRNLQNIIKDRAQFEDALTEKIATLKKSQTLALQSQISPHFLFNTLNIISMEISNALGHGSQIVSMVSLLSDILSYALNSNEYFAPFQQETESARKYVEIERLKYYGSFDVEWDIADDINPNCRVVKFMLQPIIENCFEHAIHQLIDRRGKIQISARKSGDNLIFVIADNGDGIDKEKLAQLRHNLSTMDLPDPRHIGLCNVNSRISLLFGEPYKLDIASDDGTRVTITIPYLLQ